VSDVSPYLAELLEHTLRLWGVAESHADACFDGAMSSI